MKISTQIPERLLKPAQIKNTSDEKFLERCKKTQSTFSSFIDLIPSKIYLNPEDHSNWTRFATLSENRSKKDKSNLVENGHNNSSKSSVTKKQQSSDGEDSDDNDMDIDYVNKFDTRIFKTVSQIFNDFQIMEEREKKLAKSKLQQFKKNTSVAKTTAIKIFNKSQHNTLKKQEDGSIGSISGSTNKSKSSSTSKKAEKRVSKQKEQKNIAIKRKRQRYDSHTEPQIVEINHSEANSIKDRKQILNRNGQVVFSKFDFTADKTLKTKPAKHGQEKAPRENPKDYKKLIKKLQDKREHIEQLKISEPDKAMEMETNDKWKTALDKASGVKVKDDVNLLKKALKKVEKKKEKTKRDWADRVKDVKKIKDKAQEKRQKNIDKRREKTKENKMKKLKKKGRIMPGF